MPIQPPKWYTHATIGATVAFLLGLALCLWVAPRPRKAQALTPALAPDLPITKPVK